MNRNDVLQIQSWHLRNDVLRSVELGNHRNDVLLVKTHDRSRYRSYLVVADLNI